MLIHAGAEKSNQIARGGCSELFAAFFPSHPFLPLHPFFLLAAAEGFLLR